MQKANDANNESSSVEPTTLVDFEEGHDVGSENLDTPQGSEDECDKHRFPKFKMHDYGDVVRFEIGMKFATKHLQRREIKLALPEK